MKRNQIVAACAAALWLSSQGCSERASTPSVPPPRTAPAAMSTPPPAPVPLPAELEIAKPSMEILLPLEHEEARPVDHLARAAALRETGEFDGALAEARRALFDAPEDADALQQIERCAKLAGEHELRLTALDQLATLSPDDATPLVRLARAQVALSRFDDAIATAKRAAQRSVFEPEVYQVLGRAHLGKGNLAKAIVEFEQVLAIDPAHGYALNNLGFAYLLANRNADAVEVLEQAVGVLPNVAYVHNNLGVALERVGRLDEAKAAYSEASFLSPKYLKAQLNASRIARLAEAPAIDGGMPEVMPDMSVDTFPMSEE